MRYFLYMLPFLIACSCSSPQKSVAGSGRICSPSEDSIKWKLSSLMYDVKLRKLVVEGGRYILKDDSIFNIIECDIEIVKSTEKGDSTLFFFNIYRNNRDDEYRQIKADPYSGIGYVKSACVYFPILGQTAFDVGLDYYSKFWQSQEQTFIKFLKEYKGSITPWLLNESKKRKIL